MSLLLDSYRKYAAVACIEAEQSTLPNVRERAALAAEGWSEMADRLDWVEAQGRL
jgi:hypothetical protein